MKNIELNFEYKKALMHNIRAFLLSISRRIVLYLLFQSVQSQSIKTLLLGYSH